MGKVVREMPPTAATPGGLHVNEWVEAVVLRGEAEVLLGKRTK
jgi:hypothetical protein